MEAHYTLHASRLGDWTRCEWAALYMVTAPPRERPEAGHVAGYIGRAVHAIAAGQEPPDEPAMLRFDKTTPTIAEARATIVRMGGQLEAFIARYGWTVVDHERYREDTVDEAPQWLKVAGTLDLEVMIGHERCIPDIKTGRSVQAAWLQVGTYALIHPREVHQLATIHAPRVGLAEDLEPITVEMRPAPAIMDGGARHDQTSGRAAGPAGGGGAKPRRVVRVVPEARMRRARARLPRGRTR